MQGDYGVGLGFTRYPAVAKSTGPGQVWFGLVGKGKGKGWSKRKGENAQVCNKTIEESVAILVGL